MNDLDAKIAARHPEIPQDALPGLDDVPVDTSRTVVKRRAPRAASWAKCPDHKPGGKYETTALVHGATKDELVFRDHTKKVGKHVIPCPGSGQLWTGKTYVVRQ